VGRAGGNPLAKVAAEAAAGRLRKETDDKAASIVREADEKANALVAGAKKQAGTP
jgi:cell division septum initiation protein DivIVA